MEKKESEKKKFAFPGSKFHPISLLSYTIEHMSLKIKPDLVNKMLVDCEQKIKIRAFKDLSEIVLDISDLKVTKVNSQSINISNFRCVDNKQVVVKFSEQFIGGTTVDIDISYSAGYINTDGKEEFGSPKTGFHFITKGDQPKQSPAYQAWTQGEATESRYWFPSIDKPQVKFTFEIEISAPQEYMVISNGILESKVVKDEFIIWKYIEKKPLPSYLVSVVIGRFSQYESKYRDVSLYYYWPEEIKKEDALLTFSETPQMLKFFEEYFDTNYPFQKYSQTAVDNFEFGGMENSTCTTLTRRVLHDKIVSRDYRNDIFLVIHELAHQWFGDLVTCKDWSHIWLNEGFATYCESLYWENSRGKDEFYYTLMESADFYFEESKKFYTRPIVTNIYKHPDELFDAHSYEKAGFILHMIRSQLGDSIFRKSLKIYLARYQNRAVESTDLLKVFEEASEKEMSSFFDQWVYRKGHPILEIEYELIPNHQTDETRGTKGLKIKIRQKDNNGNLIDPLNYYRFQIDFKIYHLGETGKRDSLVYSINVDRYVLETIVNLDKNAIVEAISIDPNLKILKEISNIKVLNETSDFQLIKLLRNQMNNCETIVERINAVRLFKDHFSETIIQDLCKVIAEDKFYGVAVEAANAIGTFYDKNDYHKSDKSFQGLVSMIHNKEFFDNSRTEIRRALVRNIGSFERVESINILKGLIMNSNEKSNFVKSSAAKALGKSIKGDNLRVRKIQTISLLKKFAETTDSFQNVLSTGALEGLEELSADEDHEIVIDIANFFLESTAQSKDYFIRAKATSALGKFLVCKSGSANMDTNTLNQAVFRRLKELVKDDRRKIKMNACDALVDTKAKFSTNPDMRTYETLEVLIRVAKNDLDGFVRRKAETSANIVRQWIKEWASQPLTID